jgi:hypothetical protein
MHSGWASELESTMRSEHSARVARFVGSVSAAGLVAVAGQMASAGLYGQGTTNSVWIRFNQQDVLAQFPTPAFSSTNPAEQHPIIIYYAFLEEDMLDIEWVGGEDNTNVLQIATQDNDGSGDGIITQPWLPAGGGNCFPVNPDGTLGTAAPCDLPDDEDGIADTWDSGGQPIILDIIPPPPPGTFIDPGDDPELAGTFLRYGLGNALWGDDRPIFTHEDGETVWRWAQREYGLNGSTSPGAIEFEDSLPHDIIEEEDQTNILRAMREIEKVVNVRFVERDPELGPGASQGPGAPPASISGFVQYDTSGAMILDGDVVREPDDDYPYILFTGPRTVGTDFDGGGYATSTQGNARGPAFGTHVDIDYVFDDINGDGFPDLLDSPGNPGSADGVPETIFLSNAGVPGTSNFYTTTSFILDNMGFPVGTILSDQGSEQFDFDQDGTPDTLMAVSGDVLGDGSLIVTNGGNMPNAYDRDGDGIPDDVDLDGFPDTPTISGPTFAFGGTVATLPGIAESSAIEMIVLYQPTVGVAIHEILHQMGYLHEMVRADRDQFVRINFGNIDPQEWSQFFINTSGTILGVDGDNDGQPDYDFESIMHYGSCAFITSPICTVEGRAISVLPPNENFQSVIGSGDALSAGDIASLQAVYSGPIDPTTDPCVADLNDDRRLTFQDMQIFLTAYLGCTGELFPTDAPGFGCYEVEYVTGNQDGRIDTLDLINYFALFQSTRGCSPRVITPQDVAPSNVTDNNIAPL